MKIYGDNIGYKDMNETGFYFNCKKGLKPEMPNQDNVIIAEFDHWKIFGIMDGFGPFGHSVTGWIGNNLPRILIEKIYTYKEFD